MSTGLCGELVVFGAAGAADLVVVVVAGRAGEDGGVKVERSQPKARTYDLDATVGRRGLVSDDVGSDQLSTGPGPVFASGPSGM